MPDKTGFVHFLCIQHKQGLSVSDQDQLLIQKLLFLLKWIFRGKIPRRIFPYGNPFFCFCFKMDRNMFYRFFWKTKASFGRIR